MISIVEPLVLAGLTTMDSVAGLTTMDSVAGLLVFPYSSVAVTETVYVPAAE